MKYFTILFVLAQFTCFAQDAVYSDPAKPESAGQKTKTGLPKYARVITVTTDLARDQLYQKVARLIIDEGFTLRDSDPLLGILHSGHKRVRGGWWLKVTATVDENVVNFTGLAAGQRYGGRKLINAGTNRYIFAFEAMDELAKSIPNVKIEYLP